MKQYLVLTASSLFLFLAGCGNTEEKIQSENDIDVKLTFFSNRKEAWTVQQLLYHIQSGVLNINPDYQRGNKV